MCFKTESYYADLFILLKSNIAGSLESTVKTTPCLKNTSLIGGRSQDVLSELKSRRIEIKVSLDIFGTILRSLENKTSFSLLYRNSAEEVFCICTYL